MLIKNSFIKKVNKLLLSIITLIESFFNRLTILIKFKYKKKINLKSIDKKITITVGTAVILILSYFLIPTFYDKNSVKNELKNQISEKFNLEVKFEGDLVYGLFPKPHFFIKDTVFSYQGTNIAKSDFSKIYISTKNFFQFKSLEVKNIFFRKTEFNFTSNNFVFLEKILNSNKSDHTVNFKSNILFFKNQNEDVIFFTEISYLKFFNDELAKQLISNLEIFNVPFKISIKNNFDNKNVVMNLDAHKIRLNIENKLDYSETNKKGLIDFKIISKSKVFDYEITENSLNFVSNNGDFRGDIDFKPFYLLSNLNFNQLDLKKIFKDDSIFLNILNSEILNNQNINSQINLNFDKIKGLDYLKDINLKINLEEGNIIINESNLNWNDSVLIELNDAQLIIENNSPILSGSIDLNFKDISNFYSQYQIKKIYRKKIDKIRLDFSLNVDEKVIQLDNLKIDGNSNKNVNIFLDNFNLRDINIFNKILFKNLIKQFFVSYSEG
jgi:hypothetical protein